MNGAKIASIAVGSFHLVGFIFLFIVAIVGGYFSCKRNSVLRKREILAVSIVCGFISLLEMASIASQTALFHSMPTKRTLFTVCGIIRTVSSGYMETVLILALAYQHLLYQIVSSFSIIEDSVTKDRIPRMFANPSPRFKQFTALGLILFATLSIAIGALPGLAISVWHYIRPNISILRNTFNGLQNLWDGIFLLNVIVIGIFATVYFIVGMGPRDKNGDLVARLLNFSAFIFVFELYGWGRFASAMTNTGKGYIWNSTNISRAAPVLIWVGFMSGLLLYVAATLLVSSSMFGNLFKNISNRISTTGTTTDSKIEVEITETSFSTTVP